jgi:maltose O-acetyltransferase
MSHVIKTNVRSMSLDKSQRERMLAGELYMADDPELEAARKRTRELLAKLNAAPSAAFAEQRQLLADLFGSMGSRVVVNPPFRCDYGFNIHAGSNVFFNFDCVVLDCNRVDIGDDVQFGPGVHVYTATHPLDAEERRSGLERAQPVRIGAGAWIGGRAVICPGVSIGANTVVGAGSVVVRSLPPNVLAAGNPCRTIRSLARDA